MSRNTFINLPVKDLAKTTRFFNEVGFSFNQEFSDDNAACMVISDETYAMLAVEPFFKGFTQQDITDTSTSREVVVGLSAETREEVDDRVDKALAAGGSPWAKRRTTGSCTCEASATSTGISGRSSTWTCPRSRSSRSGRDGSSAIVHRKIVR